MNNPLLGLAARLKHSVRRSAQKTPLAPQAQAYSGAVHVPGQAGRAKPGMRMRRSQSALLKRRLGWRQVQRLAGALRGQVGRWVGWALVALMCVVLLMQISAVTTRNYAIYDLEASRDRLLRERRDLVLQLSTVQPLADMAMTATAVGMQPAGADQWTVLNAPTEEAKP